MRGSLKYLLDFQLLFHCYFLSKVQGGALAMCLNGLSGFDLHLRLLQIQIYLPAHAIIWDSAHFPSTSQCLSFWVDILLHLIILRHLPGMEVAAVFCLSIKSSFLC